jgi:hypothetical protein
MAIVYLGIIIVKLPYWILRWLFQHRKIGLFLILGVVALFVFARPSCQGAKQGQATEIPYSKGIPTVVEAPYRVDTPSRYYYVGSLTENKTKDEVTLIVFWDWNGKQWTKETRPLKISKFLYGSYTINKRT